MTSIILGVLVFSLRFRASYLVTSQSSASILASGEKASWFIVIFVRRSALVRLDGMHSGAALYSSVSGFSSNWLSFRLKLRALVQQATTIASEDRYAFANTNWTEVTSFSFLSSNLERSSSILLICNDLVLQRFLLMSLLAFDPARSVASYMECWRCPIEPASNLGFTFRWAAPTLYSIAKSGCCQVSHVVD